MISWFQAFAFDTCNSCRYVAVLNGVLGASSGGRIGIAVSGRDLADSNIRPSNGGDAALLHPGAGAGVRDQVGWVACRFA